MSDEEVVNLARSKLKIPCADDIRGNITLPASCETGAGISWTADRPDVVNAGKGTNEGDDDTPPGVVARQENDAQVTLTATLTYKGISETKRFPITVKAKPAKKEYSAYLFTYFTGDSGNGEQIYFAVSKDGLNWTDLNDGVPVLTSNIGEKGVRDPYLIRSPDGDKFYLLATDLRIASGKGWGAAQTAGSTSLVIWESADLVNWSEPRMVEVALSHAGDAWAPEAFYDEKTGEYVVFWASTVRDEEGVFEPHRIYYAKTRDFCTFTKPKVFIARPGSTHIIDTTIIKKGQTYYRYSGDGQITIEKSEQLLGEWVEIGTIEASTGLTGKDVEGPLIYKFNDREQWCLMVDQYAAGKGYLPLLTSDLSSGEFMKMAPGNYSLGPNRKRHGSVLNITQEEYEAVLVKWMR